ncbi:MULTISPECIES: hypothetical protein [Burkholderia]|uniref:hypothetical protein n=1 Tax=Burkholderia TaxID=32008 RepID=UPI000B7AE665|nr:MULTISPECIES: hypothetical protein [Burkholderia]MBY4725185.1 hypothetical protein [Burkholderia contaminans]MCI3970801.1 hypothetical protein [Burkholderia sp. HI4860]OXJ04447.1 hypothetical protein CFB48_06765 [Burkholderia sp. AU33647]
MDVKFAVALDQPAQERDFAVAAGDDFRVLLDVYQTDSEDSVDPVDLTGYTLTLKIAECVYPPLTIAAPGAPESAFVFVPDNTKDACGRLSYRIYMDDATGKRTTLMHGVMVVHNDRRCGWPDGSDYGWRYGRGWPV